MNPCSITLFLSTLLLCVSTVSSQDLSRYYPLYQGTVREMRGIGSSPSITSKIEGTEIIDDSEYVKISETHKDGSHIDKVIRYVRIEDNRVYYRYPDRKDEELMFNFKAGINDYALETYYDSDGSEGQRGSWIVDNNMTVTVPAGTFEKCILYQVVDATKNDQSGSNVVYSYWFSPGIGLVKSTVIIMAGGYSPIDIWINELNSYTVPED